ncbi:MAG: virulence RhuM family protein [Bacteroidetes bacterium]|nr:virulence RhuM family protein [Bacteroidota bacterium]
MENQSEILFYTADDGKTKLQVRLEDDTVWLTQEQMSELFQKDRTVVTKHIANVFNESELNEESNVQKMHIANSDKPVKYYNLDVIISVGYRVKSARGTQFRIWATQRLKEYIVKGFALDDERLKQGGKNVRYFQELLQRIRDIRSSERNFYQQVTDIYATSIDYDPKDDLTQKFFATVQNKMHFAVHGQTAAELIKSRADSSKPLMGLVNFKGDYITARDVRIAKNYLTEKELNQLNLIVSLYLDFAELQASNERPMKMAEWIAKLDQFLALSEKELLQNAGKVSAEEAAKKAIDEFERYRLERIKNHISDFDKAVKEIAKKSRKE